MATMVKIKQLYFMNRFDSGENEITERFTRESVISCYDTAEYAIRRTKDTNAIIDVIYLATWKKGGEKKDNSFLADIKLDYNTLQPKRPE